MSHRWAATAATCGFLAVALGAFAAHGLRDRLDEPSLGIFETAVRYHMYHSLALLAVAALPLADRQRNLAGGCFLAGILLFSGSLYVLALTGARWVGAVTPAGGVSFLAGWVVLGVFSLRGGEGGKG